MAPPTQHIFHVEAGRTLPIAGDAGRPPCRSSAACELILPIRGAADAGHLVAAVRQGLRESGYPSDKVAIESRWADGRPEQLPKLARLSWLPFR
jgi:hypothetical protein